MENNDLRNKIIGLGENSFRKSYYPELNEKIEELKVFHQVFEKTNDLVILVEPNTKLIKYINNSVANHFWNKEQYINIPVSKLLGHDFVNKLDQFSKNEEENRVLIEINHLDKVYALEAVLSLISTSNGNLIVSIIRDITEHLNIRKELEQKNKELQNRSDLIKEINKRLFEAKEKAEESDKLKSAFLANMSHEIRTPMNAIMGFSSLLAKSETTFEKRQGYIDIISSSGKQLLDIINDIVDISKIEAGQLRINYTQFNINFLLKDLYTQFSFELKKNKPEIELQLHKSLPDAESGLISDQTRVRQILINLITNAIKFTSKGIIQFGYRIADNKIVFFCEDTGIGISSEHHETIFKRFGQITSSDELNSGTGLGLSISKGLLNLMNGDIFLESEQGKGSLFWFELPYKPTKTSHQAQEELPQLKENYDWHNKTFLIAEDEDFNYIFLKELLSNTKAKLIHAKSGNEVIEKFNKHPDLDMILMDIKLPNLNGIETTKKIKSINKSIPIIAQTAYALSGDREKAIRAGCDEYISKPIEKSKLLELIAKFI